MVLETTVRLSTNLNSKKSRRDNVVGFTVLPMFPVALRADGVSAEYL